VVTVFRQQQAKAKTFNPTPIPSTKKMDEKSRQKSE
jgi:hypothetical protein